MGNDFFNDHPMLGSIFDFNHDGSMSLGEAGAMGAFGTMAAREMMRASEEAEREAEYDTDFPYEGGGKKKKKKAKKESYDDLWDDPWERRLSKIDDYDKDEVFDAVVGGDLDGLAREELIDRAIDNGLTFDEDEVEEMMEYISDRHLKERLEWRMEGYL